MKILVLNASPKGKNSATVHTALYLQALHPEHEFTFVPVGQRIKSYEKDLSPLRTELERADMLLFSYPVYTFIAPSQLHRLIELIKADGVDLTGKFATQITTSKHFYDVTAHRYVEENCLDLGMRVIRGLSADMEDLTTERGREEARDFFDQLMFTCEHGPFVTPCPKAPARERTVYRPSLPETAKSAAKDVVIVTNCAADDENLANMIADFRAALPYESRVVNLREFPFGGGCLGCFGCAVTGKCVYKDGFDDFLRTKIQTADAIVYVALHPYQQPPARIPVPALSAAPVLLCRQKSGRQQPRKERKQERPQCLRYRFSNSFFLLIRFDSYVVPSYRNARKVS